MHQHQPNEGTKTTWWDVACNALAERRWLAAIVGACMLAGGLAATGCCGGKAQECNKLVTTLNKGTEQINAAMAKMNSKNGDPDACDEAARAMEATAEALKTVDLGDEELRKLGKEYEAVMLEGAKATKDLAKAWRENDGPGSTKASGEVAVVSTKDAAIVEKVNTYCAR